MPEDMPLPELASRLAADDSAVAAVYAQLAPTVLAYLRRVVPPDDAEDVLQGTFLDVWRSRTQYDPSRSLAGWVIGIAKHRAVDQLLLAYFDDLTLAEVAAWLGAPLGTVKARAARGLRALARELSKQTA